MDVIHEGLKEETLSPDDVAWADSCLSKDTGASDIDWTSMKDSLMEILTSQPQSGKQLADSKTLLSRENVRNKGDRKYDQDENLIDAGDITIGDGETMEISEYNEGYLAYGNKYVRERGRRRFDNVFGPNYTEEVEEAEYFGFGNSLNLTTYDEVEPFSEDIFKVWDLGISDELDDLTKEFVKPFVEFPEEIQLIPDGSTSRIDSMDVSVDHLIAGVCRLSLIQRT